MTTATIRLPSHMYVESTPWKLHPRSKYSNMNGCSSQTGRSRSEFLQEWNDIVGNRYLGSVGG